MVLKPCVHCEPVKYQTAPLQVCGDVDQGDILVPCDNPGCGKLRSRWRGHGYTKYDRDDGY